MIFQNQPSWRFWDEKDSKHQEGARGNTYTLGNNMNDDSQNCLSPRIVNDIAQETPTKDNTW